MVEGVEPEWKAAYVVEEMKSHAKPVKDQGLGPAAGEVAEEGEEAETRSGAHELL